MPFTKRSRQSLSLGFSVSLVFLISSSYGPRCFLAQTPQVAPAARLLVSPGNNARSSRARGISSGSEAEGHPALSDSTEIEKRAFEMTNTIRLQNGFAPLAWDPALCKMARALSEQMVRLGFFSHETPDGSRLKARARAAGIAHFRVLGENIAYNHGADDPGASAVKRWMLSPGHRANLLSTEFDRSAVGSFIAPDGAVYITQEFIKR